MCHHSSRGAVELELPGGLCVLDGGGEVAGQAGAFEGLGVAAFGQQPHAPDDREYESVEEPVGELDGRGVAA